MSQPAKVAIPATAASGPLFGVQPRDAPAGVVMVRVTPVVLPVTVFPPASWIDTEGCWAKSVPPVAVALGWVVNPSRVALTGRNRDTGAGCHGQRAVGSVQRVRSDARQIDVATGEGCDPGHRGERPVVRRAAQCCPGGSGDGQRDAGGVAGHGVAACVTNRDDGLSREVGTTRRDRARLGGERELAGGSDADGDRAARRGDEGAVGRVQRVGRAGGEVDVATGEGCDAGDCRDGAVVRATEGGARGRGDRQGDTAGVTRDGVAARVLHGDDGLSGEVDAPRLRRAGLGRERDAAATPVETVTPVLVATVSEPSAACNV